MSSMRMSKKKDSSVYVNEKYSDTDPLLNKLLDIQKKQSIYVSNL